MNMANVMNVAYTHIKDYWNRRLGERNGPGQILEIVSTYSWEQLEHLVELLPDMPVFQEELERRRERVLELFAEDIQALYRGERISNKSFRRRI